MDSALLGVVLGGLIGVSAQVIAARFARQQQWADARREVYSHYLEQISVGRRRLQEEVERRMHGQPDSNDAQIERRRIREEAIAGWNRVRLVTQSKALERSARELQNRVATLNEMLEGERDRNDMELEEVRSTYEQNRLAFVQAAQQEIGLSGLSKWRPR